MLSRLPVDPAQEVQVQDKTEIFNVSQLEILPLSLSQLTRATRNDPILSRVFEYTKYGHASSEFKQYETRKHELTIQSNWGIRVIVPPSLRNSVLQELHCGHPGMTRMKSLARSHVWWPGLDKEVENLCRSCTACQEVKPSPATAPLHPWVWPTSPWQHVHIDYAGPFLNTSLVDSPRNIPTSASKTFETLRFLFSSFGLPEQLVSDNSSQFTSQEFADFMKFNGIKHIKTGLYHPSSNVGAIERLVQSFKRSMLASRGEKKSIENKVSNFLLKYRVTPHATTNVAHHVNYSLEGACICGPD